MRAAKKTMTRDQLLDLDLECDRCGCQFSSYLTNYGLGDRCNDWSNREKHCSGIVVQKCAPPKNLANNPISPSHQAVCLPDSPILPHRD